MYCTVSLWDVNRVPLYFVWSYDLSNRVSAYVKANVRASELSPENLNIPGLSVAITVSGMVEFNFSAGNRTTIDEENILYLKEWIEKNFCEEFAE